jgi:hypothetical protein
MNQKKSARRNAAMASGKSHCINSTGRRPFERRPGAIASGKNQ